VSACSTSCRRAFSKHLGHRCFSGHCGGLDGRVEMAAFRPCLQTRRPVASGPLASAGDEQGAVGGRRSAPLTAGSRAPAEA
jgi:hypothetical protein